MHYSYAGSPRPLASFLAQLHGSPGTVRNLCFRTKTEVPDFYAS
jgi:hypothetical protein